MKTETMTPRWVVENFLPDYEQKMLDALNARPSALVCDIRVGFIERYFPDAISELLKAQRTICQDVFDSSYKSDQVEDVYFNRRIENATIPESKNRK